ncbi:transglycosylase SLT domain-containing protein [Roseomonas terrae]|uniref:Transglycosylase SLT domain-containing protein n=1 Tax=Neoroseomonas terrae TaxID=424799 RepID=A0ABS5EH59_9PROT|nr:transglycosylase SLT domain-containing protein [Neoroseomonas terrae]MBR0650361.1 transglycosylase SLT domain-containing protein [Neoroseomonas terrae]
MSRLREFLVRLVVTPPDIVESRFATACLFASVIMSILFGGQVLACSSASAGTLFPSRYDAQIRASVARHWPDHPDWLAWRAQLYQESRLRPDAVSPVGAAGLAQFMPGTWRDVVRELRLPPGVSPHQDIAIDAGAYFMAKMRRAWSSPRPSSERHRLAQASYNAGLGNILRAQSRCGGARDWADIVPCLPLVTGTRNAAETRGYVEAIARWRLRMIADGATP